MVAEDTIPGSFNIPNQICKRCGEPILEGHAYELGEDRWHIHCFKCSKCDTSLGCNSNFLVLGNGNLICSNCSYNCKQCGKKIDDLAILTGDQAYCSLCFKCRSCKLKIEDLRYARTSKGLFCMNCHEKLIAKKKKHDSKKKLLAQSDGLAASTPPLGPIITPDLIQQPRNRSNSRLDLLRSESPSLSRSSSRKNVRPPPSDTPVDPRKMSQEAFMANNRSVSSISTKDKVLPAPPVSEQPAAQTPYSQLVTQNSYQSTRSAISSISQATTAQSDKQWDKISPVNSNTSSLEEIVDSDDELNQKTLTSPHKRLQTPPMQTGNLLQPAAQIGSSDHPSNIPKIESPSFVSKRNFQGKDLLILSPNQYYGDKLPVHSPVKSLSSDGSKHNGERNGLEPGHDRQRGNASPFARANRQARVLETSPEHSKNDSTQTEEFSQQTNTETSTPVRRKPTSPPQMSSPPPSVPVPNVPTTPNGSRDSDKIPSRSANRSPFKNVTQSPHGLGLEGMEYYDPDHIGSRSRLNSDSLDKKPEFRNGHERVPLDPKASRARVIGNSTPTVTNLEEPEEPSNDQEDLSRKYSFKPSKFSLKHKRSTSGGSNGGLANKFNPFKANERGHARHVSEGSMNGNSAYTTPPLPRTSPMNHTTSFGFSPNHYSGHNRSTSDTPFVSNLEGYTSGNEYHKNELELRAMRLEMYQLESLRVSVRNEMQGLTEQKAKLTEAVDTIKDKFNKETTNYEILMREISELEKAKAALTEENHRLRAENDQLDASLKTPRNSEITSTTDSIVATSQGSGTTPLTKLTSSSSYINEVPNYSNYDEQIETNKATKLKFWRRAKLGSSNSPGQSIPIQVSTPQIIANKSANGNGNGPKISLSHSYNSINGQAHEGNHSHSNSANGNDFLSVDKLKKNNQSFFTRSKSSNILDSIIGLGNANAADTQEGGAPLFSSTIQQRANFENELVPFMVTKCIQEVEVRGLDMEGIYRISGGNSAIVNIENCFASLTGKNDEKYQKLLEALDVDINAVTSALKRYLRKLPEPLIPYNLYNEYIRVGQSKQSLSPERRVQELKTLVINRLSPANRTTLELLCNHLSLVRQNQSVNRMGTKNLSVVFAPTLARDQTGEREMTDMGHRNDATELLLDNYEQVFN